MMTPMVILFQYIPRINTSLFNYLLVFIQMYILFNFPINIYDLFQKCIFYEHEIHHIALYSYYSSVLILIKSLARTFDALVYTGIQIDELVSTGIKIDYIILYLYILKGTLEYNILDNLYFYILIFWTVHFWLSRLSFKIMYSRIYLFFY